MDSNVRLVSVGGSSRVDGLDVVFVHGLTGGPYTTWNGNSDAYEDGRIPEPDQAGVEPFKEDLAGESYLPAFIKGDLRINVWSVGYPAPICARDDPLGYAASLDDACRPVVSRLLAASVATRPASGLVLIGHSLGGLMIKAILRHAASSSDRRTRALLDSCVGVGFVATPHSGSGLATLLGNLEGILKGAGFIGEAAAVAAGHPWLTPLVKGAASVTNWFANPSNQVRWLQKAGPELRSLAESYRTLAWQRSINTRAYYETQPFKGVAPKSLMWIVDASNADPAVQNCLPMPVLGADHTSIAKPDRASLMYGDMRAWLKSLDVDAKRGTDRPVLDEEIEAMVAEIQQREPALASSLRPLPRRMEEIPTTDDVRTRVSHLFRRLVGERLRQDLGDRLRAEPKLLSQLSVSMSDFDRLILFQWLGLMISDASDLIRRQLEVEISEFETTDLQKGPPSLIRTFRLVDALRESLLGSAAGLSNDMDELLTQIRELANSGLPVDQDGRTSKLLSDGRKVLAQLGGWEKPPKAPARGV